MDEGNRNTPPVITTSASTQSSSRRAMMRFAAPAAASGAEGGEAPGSKGPTDTVPVSGSAAVTMTDLTLAELMKTLGVEVLGQKNDETGNRLIEYVDQVGGDATRTLETKDEEGVTSWSVDISVPLEDPQGTPYKYYVVETDPAGDNDEWETTYIGQSDGLENNGKVTIVNKKKPTVTNISVLKVIEGTNTPCPARCSNSRRRRERASIRPS